jgi:hypothetical protein
MDRRVAAVSYVGAGLVGILAAWLVCQALVLAVPKSPEAGPHPAAPYVFIGALLVVYAGLGAMFVLALPTRSWVALGISLGGSSFLLYAACWWLGGPTRRLLTDILPLATPILGACIGAYGGAWLRHRRESANQVV